TQTTYDARLNIPADTAKAYVAKLTETEKTEQAQIKNLEARLKNTNYVQNAPAAVVAQTRAQLEDTQARLKTISAEMKRFGA
ncbi:MAG TPA: hypothetical protein VKQ34_04100, partial [Candidatus Saccharimonadales bacterium]|nr:hypothetical protein [Candidatus Saccharimonadales bacterium]